MVFVGGEENIVKRKTQPMDQAAEGPDEVEKDKKDRSFFGEAGCGVFRCKEGTVERAPEKPEVISHSGRDP